MAEKSEALRQILQTIRDDAQQALTLFDSSGEERSLGWKCQRCGHIKHFTQRVPADVAVPCPKCRGEVFEQAEG